MRLEKRIINPGDGESFPTAGDTVKVHYSGWLFDSRKNDRRGKEYEIPFLQLVPNLNHVN